MYMKTHEGFVALYTENNITIWGQIEHYISEVLQSEYDVINQIKITVDGKLIYSTIGNTLHFPYNTGDNSVMNFENYVEKIIFIIENFNDNNYVSTRRDKIVNEATRLLDSLLHDKSNLRIELAISKKKRQLESEVRQNKYNEVQKTRKELQKEIESLLTDVNLFICDIYVNPIITDLSVGDKKNLTEYMSRGEKQRIEAETHIIAWYQKEDFYKPSMKHDEDTVLMYRSIIEFLKGYKNKNKIA